METNRTALCANLCGRFAGTEGREDIIEGESASADAML